MSGCISPCQCGLQPARHGLGRSGGVHGWGSCGAADSSFPLLGDPLYDYRTRSLLGHKVKLTTAHTESRRCQVLPPSMLDLIGLHKGEEWEVPRMVHFHRIHLSDWLGKDTHLTVFAPPPEYFARTCQTLGIAFDYSKVAETDTIKLWKQDTRKKKRKTVSPAP